MENVKIFACSDAAEGFTEKICSNLGVEKGKINRMKFKNDNNFVQILETVREKDVFVIQTTQPPVNERIMELLITVDAIKRAAARRITVVLPYYIYSRSDKKDQPRIPVTAKLLAQLIEAAGADRVLTCDLHNPAIQAYFRINCDILSGRFLLEKYFDDKYHINDTVVAPVVPEQGGSKMKYNASNKPLVCMQTNSTCYKGTSKMTVKGVLWHSTGANNPTLKRYVQPSDNAPDRAEMLKLLGTNSYKNDWNHVSVQAGLNCWIGKLADGTVTTVQTMPWDYRPWGCGSGPKGSCNNGWIQFEICEDGLTDKAYFDKVYKEACEITAYLCKMYNIDPHGTVTVNGVKVPTILCHADSHKLGLGSNHGDVNHWFPKHGKSMETARNDVAALMKDQTSVSTPVNPDPTPEKPVTTEMYRVRKSWDNPTSQIGAYRSLENAKKACDAAGKNYAVFNQAGKQVYPEIQQFPYLVKINTSVLNVRSGAGTNYKVTTQVKRNQVYTIVDQKNNWGKLKSGAGWICLDYTKKI